MTVTLNWFLPTNGDGRSVVDRPHSHDTAVTTPREPSLDYLAQVARAAEDNGFHAVLTPTGTWCEDAWVATAALIGATRKLKFLVAFRPGTITPTLAAHMSATYQKVSNGRLMLNIVTGGDSTEQQRFGDWLDHDRRYERTDEFMRIVSEIWSTRDVDFEGEHYRLRNGTTFETPAVTPPLYFGGNSEAALPVAARRADVHLTWGETPEKVGGRIERLRELAEQEGRSLQFGVRAHVITRDRTEDAWAVAQRFLEQMDPEEVKASQAKLARSESTAQKGMTDLHGDTVPEDARDLEVHPGLWAGVGLLRGGAGTAFVGSHEEVADLIEQYHDVGVEHFVLSGYPHLEEAYWVGEGLRPELRRRGILAPEPA